MAINSPISRCHISSVALVYRVRQASEQDVVAETKQLTAGNGAELSLDPVGGPGFTRLAHASAVGGTLILYGALAQKSPAIVIVGTPITGPPASLASRPSY